MTDVQARPEKRRRGLKIVLGALATLAVTLLVAGLIFVGRPVAAPDWLRDRIEARIAQTLPDHVLRFGQMSVLVQRSGLARVILWDVELSTPDGAIIAQLSDIEGGFAPSDLLRGRVALREAQVSGAFVTLTRDKSGRLGLSLGDAWGAQATPDANEIMAQLEATLKDPRLARLSVLEADALTIRYEDLRARRGWTVDGGRVRATRTGNALDLSGDFALLGGGDSVAALELNANVALGSPEIEFGVTLDGLAARDIASQSPALAWLDALDAPISGSLRSRFEADGSLGPMNAVLSIGQGALAPNPATRPIPFDAARTYFTFDPIERALVFDEIAVRSPLGRILAEGRAGLQGTPGGWPSGLWGQLRLSDIELAEGAVLDRSVQVSGAEMAFKLGFEPFHLTLGELSVTDPDLPLAASATVLATTDGWQLGLDAQAKSAEPDKVLSFWPEDFRPRGRLWVSEHVQDGQLSDVQFSLRLAPDTPPQTHLSLAFDEGRVLFNKRLPPIEAASGRLVLDGPRLGLRLTRGLVQPAQGGALNLAGTDLAIADLRERPAQARIGLRARGSGTAALSFLDNEAWRVLSRIDRDAGLATGRVELSGELRLPLRKGLTLPDIDMALSARLDDVETTSLIANRKMTGTGLRLSATNAALEIRGAVTVDGVPAEGVWRQPLQGGQGSVEATVQISPEALQAFGVALPDGLISGTGSGTLSLDLAKGGASFTLSSNLRGLGMAIPQLGWRLPQSGQGRFSIAGTLGQPVQVDSLALNAAGLRAEGDLRLRPGGGLEVLRLNRLRVDNWLDVSARLRGRGAGQPPGVEVRGGRVDLRFAPFGKGDASAQANGGETPLSLALDELQVSQNIALNRFAGEFTSGTGIAGTFTARVGGTAPVTGQVVPQNGGTAIRVEGRDAGDILKAAGILRKVQDGRFRLDLAPVTGRTGQYDGLLTIRETRLQGGSAITGLLDAISIVGIMDQLNGPGIYFEEVEARFRLTPERVIVSRSSAIGPSMGISLDGYYDLAAGQMDMQGVLSPVYLINGIGRLFARKGEGLIGFNFNMRGSADAPRITVNPLSVFTPGMFRDIFRRPPPKLSQ